MSEQIFALLSPNWILTWFLVFTNLKGKKRAEKSQSIGILSSYKESKQLFCIWIWVEYTEWRSKTSGKCNTQAVVE